ncbi:MAG: glycoside hydrolase family 99-like domain-containing protein [Candidatus Saccharibacteria bacterium]|nr:glycoside hydrolase family 99-like domain-containing protein [Moraxellaceae bacterium]
MDLRALAIYLPQFHPVRENDEWWGKGFTEWTNVTKSKARFANHYQPQLPSDLGFYDLRVAETRQQQADLARQFGIHGFCYYHYWFNGRRILETPFEEVLNSSEPDFPFCLCWANENWTRRWDGEDKQVLLQQNYSEDDDREHIRSLASAFKDSRYIKVDGKPVFIVYRINALPDPKRTTDIWRDEARKLGIGELYLMRMEISTHGIDPISQGLDSAIEFQPDWPNLPQREYGSWKDRALNRLRLKASPFWQDIVVDYRKVSQSMMGRARPKYKLFPGVAPNFDNSPRRATNATIFVESSPEKYEEWLQHVVDTFVPYSKDENFIFINAWNEWAEGNHLEPCRKWGIKYLQATAKALGFQNKK